MIEVLNKKILAIAEKSKSTTENSVTFSLKNLNNLFNIRIQNVFDCIILVDEEEVVLSSEQFEKVIKRNQDKTGYEAANNELRIIDYSKSLLTEEEQYLIGKILIENLDNRISGKVVYYFGFNQGILTLRFHKFREEDGFWTNENVEEYNEPLGYFISK